MSRKSGGGKGGQVRSREQRALRQDKPAMSPYGNQPQGDGWDKELHAYLLHPPPAAGR